MQFVAWCNKCKECSKLQIDTKKEPLKKVLALKQPFNLLYSDFNRPITIFLSSLILRAINHPDWISGYGANPSQNSILQLQQIMQWRCNLLTGETQVSQEAISAAKKVEHQKRNDSAKCFLCNSIQHYFPGHLMTQFFLQKEGRQNSKQKEEVLYKGAWLKAHTEGYT